MSSDELQNIPPQTYTNQQQSMPENSGVDVDPDQPKEDKNKTFSWKANIQLLIVLGFIITGFIISQSLNVEEEKQKQDIQTKDLLVETKTITPQTKEIEFTRTGNVVVNGQIDIVPQVSGRIISVHPDFNNGGVFKKGDTLFQIESADFINAVNIANAQVEQARTALVLQQAESNIALEEWKSLNPHRDAPALVARKPQMQQAQANLKAAQAQLADTQLALKRTKFTYNFSGRIVDTSIELGQFVQAGQSYGQAYPRDALEIIVPVEDRILQYINIKDGNKVKINTKYRGEEVNLEGEIDRIGGVVNQTTRFIDVIIKPAQKNWDVLLPGVFTQITLIGQKTDNIWTLPNEALQGTNDIWIVNSDQTLERFTPKIITISDNETDAIGNGQKIDVVLGLIKGVDDGTKVRTSNKTDNSNELLDPPAITSPVKDNLDEAQ